MKIRIHDTDFDGNPVECTGEFFRGATALDIVIGMKMNPFNSHLEPLAFMRQTLSFIGQKDFALPEDEPAKAAQAFLQRLTALGFAHYEIDDGELDADHPAETGVPPEKK
jgi:hypothetical protein